MFFKLTKFEWKYLSKQSSFYVTALIFFLLTFGSMTIDNIQLGGAQGNVNLNSPFAIMQSMAVLSIFGMFVVANFVGNTATRDKACSMDGIILSTPVSKMAYLWGRFFGAFLICMTIFCFCAARLINW